MTLPWAWYAEPDQLRREFELIFARAWQYVGHAGRAAEPGAYFTATAGRVPIVVVRGRDESLRGFVNVCRHRGHPVAQGQGRRETLQCAYHAWTYDLDGTLRSAPRSDREAAFDLSEIALRPVRLETWGPFVFVNPHLEAAPLAEALGEVPRLVAELGIHVDALEFRLRSEGEVAANWKVVCENYLECYHCAVAHPGFSALVDVSPDAYRLETEGLTASQFGPVRAAAAASYDAEGEIGRSQFHFVWPNLTINVFPGRVNLSIGSVLPVGIDRTARFLDYFFGPGADDEWVEDLLEFDEQVGREDRRLVEAVQRGVGAGVIEHGRLLPEAERLVVHFQQLTLEALGKTA